MHTWFPVIFFLVLTGLIATAVIGWERENRARARKRHEQSLQAQAQQKGARPEQS
jgi:hypothetical protein